MMDNFRGRQSIRLKGYDYSQPGYYCVTICVSHRDLLFGEIARGKITLNDTGSMITEVWSQIPIYYPGNDIDAFVVMPNHIHGIIIVREKGTSRGQSSGGIAPTGLPLPEIVQRFKSLTTKRYAEGMKLTGWQPFIKQLWQRNYYERVIRDDLELNALREYILYNPENWEKDEEFIL
jgi:putative transposase